MGEIQVGERMGGLMGMISVVRVRVATMDSRPSLCLLLVWWREGEMQTGKHFP